MFKLFQLKKGGYTMRTIYYYQVYNVNTKTGLRTDLIATGTTEEMAEKITARTKTEQLNALKCKYGYGKSYYLKRVEK
jgi:hypothetical protein